MVIGKYYMKSIHHTKDKQKKYRMGRNRKRFALFYSSNEMYKMEKSVAGPVSMCSVCVKIFIKIGEFKDRTNYNC